MNPRDVDSAFKIIPIKPTLVTKDTLCVGVFMGWKDRKIAKLYHEDVLRFASVDGFDLGQQHHLNAIVKSQNYDMRSFFDKYQIMHIIALGTTETRTSSSGTAQKYHPMLLPPSPSPHVTQPSHMGLLSQTEATAAYEPGTSGFVLIKK